MTILDEIVAHKREEVRLQEEAEDLKTLKQKIAAQSPARNLLKTFQENLNEREQPQVIAECKRQSPSKGVLRENYNPAEIAQQYEDAGAAAISCLTDEKYFGGHLDHLSQVHATVKIPLLRKDFIVTEYQIYQARAYGADSFLLLSGVLNQSQLSKFIEVGRSLGMEPLVESHTEEELRMALAAGSRLVGVNNRNLKTFEVSLDHGKRLMALCKDLTSQLDANEIISVCESGIRSGKDIRNMWQAGYRAFLIGESLMKAVDVKTAFQELMEI